MDELITLHIEGPDKGMRVYISMTKVEWDHYNQICKDNPNLSQWECKKLIQREPQSK